MITIKLDAKFYGEIRKVKDDSLLRDEEYMVFIAHDNAFALILPIYRAICLALGADDEHLAAVDRTIDRLNTWRNNNPHELKTPNAKGERLAG